MLEINPVKLNITYLNFTWKLNTSHVLMNFVEDPPLPSISKMPGTNYSTFNLTMNNVTSTIYICENRNVKTGNYFFEPLILPNTRLTSVYDPYFKQVNYTILESLPQGMEKTIDFNDLFKGSFLKYKLQSSNSTSEVANDYLDSHFYKIRLKKTKFLESIFGFESNDKSKHRIHFFLSTAYENIVVSGDRYQQAVPGEVFNYTNLRDFRALSTMYPTGLSSALLQVDDLTYSIKMDQSINQNAQEEPSKGINGVCSNNTVINHYKLGDILVCIQDGKAYMRQLEGNGFIIALEMDYLSIQRLSSIREIKFMRSSDFFRNYIFVFYY